MKSTFRELYIKRPFNKIAGFELRINCAFSGIKCLNIQERSESAIAITHDWHLYYENNKTEELNPMHDININLSLKMGF